MSSKVTLDETLAELSAYPKVMVTPFDPKRDPSQAILVVDFNDGGGQELPKLTAFIEQARQAANAYSSTDTQIPPVDVIKITNDPDFVAFGSYTFGDDGKRYLIIRTDLLLGMNNDMALSMLTHEFKHAHHNDGGKLSSMTDVERQSIELDADRAAEKPIAQIAALLAMMTSQHFVKNYHQTTYDTVHPPFQARVRALLEEAYGNEIFRSSGKFDQDWHFQPKRQDFIPVLEDGKKLLNWDNELAPAITKLADADMHYLDGLVGKVDRAIEPEVVQQFIDHIIPRIENFHAHHIFNLEDPTNDYLAIQFEKALQVSALREAVMSMHEKMPLAFKAYDEAVKQASYFVTPSAQDAVINSARQHIVDGISEGKYPETKQSQAISEALVIQVSHVAEIAQ